MGLIDVLNIIEIGVLIGTLFIIWFYSHKQTNELKNQIWLNTFLDTTRRYQGIISRIPPKYYNNDLSFEDKELNEDIKYFRPYFNLCSEEFFLNKWGNIKKEIWVDWLEEMKKLSSFNSFRQAWELINKVAAYDKEFIDFYSNLILK